MSPVVELGPSTVALVILGVVGSGAVYAEARRSVRVARHARLGVRGDTAAREPSGRIEGDGPMAAAR